MKEAAVTHRREEGKEWQPLANTPIHTIPTLSENISTGICFFEYYEIKRWETHRTSLPTKYPNKYLLDTISILWTKTT